MSEHEGFPSGTAQRSVSASGAPGASEALDRLVPSARLPERVRLRVGVGAAIVLLLVALVVTVVVSAVGQQSGSRIVAADAEAVPGPPGAAEAAESAGGSPGSGRTAGPAASLEGGDEAGATVSGTLMFVHVLGAVARPGLFELGEGARVIDAVSAAGGLTEDADPAGTNLARRLTDGEQLYLPRVGEVAPGVPPGGPAGAAAADAGTGSGVGGGVVGALVNLNSATVADLDTLPRIGPAMAQRILDYRDASGPFASTDELRNITGIGDKTFEALKDLVTV